MNYRQKKLKQFEKENKKFETGQIVFIGDSLTDWYDLENYYVSFNLPNQIYNRGISGDSTNGLLQRLDNSLIDLQPAVAVILIGAKDLRNDTSKEQVTLNYANILQRIKEKLPDTKILVQSIYPINKKSTKNKATLIKVLDSIIQTNIALQELTQSYNYTFIDVFSSLKIFDNTLNPEYSDDGLHLNDSGYKVVTQYIIRFINDIMAIA